MFLRCLQGESKLFESVEPYVYDLPVPMRKPRVTSSAFSWKPIVFRIGLCGCKNTQEITPDLLQRTRNLSAVKCFLKLQDVYNGRRLLFTFPANLNSL